MMGLARKTAMPWLLRSVWQQVRDPIRASRVRWLAFGWVFCLFELAYGGALLVGGEHVIAATGVFVIFAHAYGVSWGIRLHGAIIFFVGLLTVVGLSAPALGYPEPRMLLKRSLLAAGFYWAWSAGMVCLSPLVPGGTFSLLAVLTLTTLAFWPTMLGIAPPPVLAHRGEDLLIRLALDRGVSPEVAADLAGAYFYESHPDAGRE